MLKTIKKYLGVIWIFISVAAIVVLIIGAFENIDIHGKLDINKPMPWIIITVIFIPIAFALSLFGWYVLHDEYSTKK